MSLSRYQPQVHRLAKWGTGLWQAKQTYDKYAPIVRSTAKGIKRKFNELRFSKINQPNAITPFVIIQVQETQRPLSPQEVNVPKKGCCKDLTLCGFF